MAESCRNTAAGLYQLVADVGSTSISLHLQSTSTSTSTLILVKIFSPSRQGIPIGGGVICWWQIVADVGYPWSVG